MTKRIHSVFAHPVLLSWGIGAAILDAATFYSVASKLPGLKVLSDVRVVAWLLLVLTASTLLGYFCGMFTVWPLMRNLCIRLNGGPYDVGDQVMILSGVHKGKITSVAGITVSQGGWNLLILDLGAELREQCGDIFEEYSVLLYSRE